MATLFQQLQQKFNQLITPYKPPPPPKKTASPTKKASPPISKAGVKDVAKKVYNTPIVPASIPAMIPGTPSLLTAFMKPKMVTPKQVVDQAKELTGIPALNRASNTIGNTLIKKASPNITPIQDNKLINKHLSTLPGSTPYKPSKTEKTITDYLKETQNEETVKGKENRFSGILQKGVKVPLLNKEIKLDKKTADKAAPVLAFTALGVDTAGMIGGGKKEGLEEGIRIAKNADNIEDFAKGIEKASPEVKKIIQEIFDDSNNKINTIEDFYKTVKNEPQAVDISSGDTSGALRSSMNNEAGKSIADTQVPDFNTSALTGNPPSMNNLNTSPSNRTNFVSKFSISTPSQSDFNTFYSEMQGQEKPFLASLTNVVKDISGQAAYRMKTPESIVQKIKRKPGRVLGNINDTLGATVVVDDVSKIDEALNKAKSTLNITGVTDYRQKPTFLGYKAIHMDNELPNGSIAEVQVNTKEGMYQKEYAHTIYDKWRQYIEHNGATTMQDVVDLIKNKEPEKLMEFKNDVKLSNDIYEGKVKIPDEYIKAVDKQLTSTGEKMGLKTKSVPQAGLYDVKPIIDKQQRVTSYVSGAGKKVFETEQYNAQTKQWYTVGDSTTSENLAKATADKNNLSELLNKYLNNPTPEMKANPKKPLVEFMTPDEKKLFNQSRVSQQQIDSYLSPMKKYEAVDGSKSYFKDPRVAQQPLSDAKPGLLQSKTGEVVGNTSPQAATPSTDKGFLGPQQSNTTQQIPVSKTQEQSSEEIISKVLKERKFATSVKQSPDTKITLKKGIDASTETKYNPITNKNTLEEATNIVNTDLNKANQMVFESKKPLDATTSTVGQLLIKKAQDAGDYATAIRTVEKLSERATEAGQSIQALNMFSRLTPEGVLRYAETVIKRANENGKNIKLTEKQAKKLVDQAEQLQLFPEGREKTLQTAELLRDINEIVPPSWLKKISTLQTMMQLLNPKTLIRNTAGNVIFSGLENVSKLIATGIDKPLSVVTGKRSVTGPDLLTQFKGAKKGGKEGLEEALRGVNTKKMGTKFDIPQDRVFKGKILGTAEKALNVGLRVPDRAFYQAAYDESLLSAAKVIAKNEGLKGPAKEARIIDLLKSPTDDMLGQANADGLYRTFQDKNTATQIFTGLKKSLNAGKEFGLGDFVIKYPKTPANLLMRSLEYSPLGFIKGIKQIANPLFKQKFNQKEFVDSLGRATVGTVGLVGTGIILQKAGILTTTSSKDKDLRALEQDQGIGQYRVNVSGLKRFISSGFNKDVAKIRPGDRFVSYDWAQPMAVSIAMGGEMAKAQTESGDSKNIYDAFSKIGTAGFTNLAAGIDTLAEQPLVSGVQRFFGGQSATDSVIEAVLTAPSSMIPTFLSQVNQVLDNNKRETYDPNRLKQSLNSVLAKIPILSATLPVKPNTFGEDAQRYQKGSNNIWNVFLNPAFVTKYLPKPEADMVLELNRQTGETKQVPRIVDKKITIDGETKVLTQDEFVTYQKLMGTVTKDVFGNLKSSPMWKEANPEDQVQLLQTVMTKINKEVKKGIFNSESKKQSSLLENFVPKANAAEKKPDNPTANVKTMKKNPGESDYDFQMRQLKSLETQLKPQYDEVISDAKKISQYVESNKNNLAPRPLIAYELNNKVNADVPESDYSFYEYVMKNASEEDRKRINELLDQNSTQKIDERLLKRRKLLALAAAMPVTSTYFQRDLKKNLISSFSRG